MGIFMTFQNIECLRACQKWSIGEVSSQLITVEKAHKNNTLRSRLCPCWDVMSEKKGIKMTPWAKKN